jgi:lipoyl(octanoyl) transferase
VRVEGRSGVWVPGAQGSGGQGPGGAGPDRKVAAIGVRVARGVTMHGFALNCDCDLSWYSRIVACGLPDAEATSLTAELGRTVTVQDVVPLVEDRLASFVSPRTLTP